MRKKLVKRFLKYVSFDTQSDEYSNTYPSTAKQLELTNYLVEDLKSLGLTDAAVDQYGFVTAPLPGNVQGKDVPVIGFLAHMDTSPEFPPSASFLKYILTVECFVRGLRPRTANLHSSYTINFLGCVIHSLLWSLLS